MIVVKLKVDAVINLQEFKAGDSVRMTEQAAKKWVESGKAELSNEDPKDVLVDKG